MEQGFSEHEVEVIHLRDDLATARGNRTRLLRDFKYDLGVALVALQNGHPEVAEQRIARLLNQINAALES